MPHAFLASPLPRTVAGAGRHPARLWRALAASTLALMLAACTAPAPQSPAPAGDAVAAAPTPASAPAAPAVIETPAAKAGGRPGAMPAPPDRSCRTDSDCTVKDVGNCCGYFPMCVNTKASTDPAAVRAACEREGIASACGFQEVKGCRCVENRCENQRDGLPEAM